MKIINALFVALLLTGILGFSTAPVMAEEIGESESWFLGSDEQE